jgi:hypothetical protein
LQRAKKGRAESSLRLVSYHLRITQKDLQT